jgi:exo-beta-1,3-glucanase (GH17 family)
LGNIFIFQVYPIIVTQGYLGHHLTPLINIENVGQIKISPISDRAKQFVTEQYQGVLDYMQSIGANKPLHIGETGWATVCVQDYGAHGSKAADEYKSGLYF